MYVPGTVLNITVLVLQVTVLVFEVTVSVIKVTRLVLRGIGGSISCDTETTHKMFA
jgi:hypothetical protein